MKFILHYNAHFMQITEQLFFSPNHLSAKKNTSELHECKETHEEWFSSLQLYA